MNSSYQVRDLLAVNPDDNQEGFLRDWFAIQNLKKQMNPSEKTREVSLWIANYYPQDNT